MTKNEAIRSTRPSGLLATAIDTLRARREERAETRRLERELCAFTSKSDLDDLYAILARYDDADTALVRSVLAKQRARAA